MSASDEESDADGFCYLSLKAIIYSRQSMYSYNLNIDSVLDATINSICFSKEEEKSSKISSPKSPANTKLAVHYYHKAQKDKKVSQQVLSILKSRIPMLKELSTPLFWIVQLKVTFPENKKDIRELETEISKIYREFLYKFQTNKKVASKVVDQFIYCLPYFFTQAIQDMFIRLLQGNPSCMDRDFRMKVCSILVELFTGIKPVDSLLKARLSYYFIRPPDADIPESTKNKCEDEELCPSVSIPIEDLSTLVDLPKRQRPCVYSWHSSSVSPFIAKGLNRSVLPYMHDSILHLTLPKNGEDDWKSDLPPLLINKDDQSEVTDIKDYDPSKDSRSLLYRARRPNIISEFRKNGEEFMKISIKRKMKEEMDINDLTKKKEKIRRKDPLVLEEWVKDLNKLQQDKKHGETPEFKRLADIKKEKTPLQLKREKEEKEREESENKFDYEPYYEVCELSDKIILHEAVKPTYSKLFERELILEKFRL